MASSAALLTVLLAQAAAWKAKKKPQNKRSFVTKSKQTENDKRMDIRSGGDLFHVGGARTTDMT